MNPNSPPIVTPPGANLPPEPAAKRRPWCLYICVGLFAFVLLIIATVAITLWWSQRPMKPVILSAAEKTTLDEKLQHLSSAATNATVTPEPDRVYVKGTNVLQLTEREINGLLNQNTDLGKSVRLELEE